MDVIAFLKQGKCKSFAFTTLREWRKLPPFVTSRLLACYGLWKRHFSVSEFICLILPGRFRTTQLQNRFWEFLDLEAEAEFAPFLAPDGSLILFGRPFRVPRFGEEGGGYWILAVLLFEVIVFDQYQIVKYLTDAPDGTVVIDAGANLGTFSVFASHVAPQAKIYAFEPAPTIFYFLKESTVQ